MRHLEVKEGDQGSGSSCEKRKRIIGTIEPDWINEREFIGDGIKDDDLAFIYGAIKKYGSFPEYYPDLKEYILKIAQKIGER